MISVEAALCAILDGAAPLGGEEIALSQVTGRISAADIIAPMDQPPFAASAMDGYAVRFDDMRIGAKLSVIDEAPAGAPAAKPVTAGTAIRLFTGSLIPDGADHVIIQEDVIRDGEVITVTAEQPRARNIRKAGIDFAKGAVLARAGDRLGPVHGSVFAAANITEVSVIRRPRIGFFANGDELCPPGSALAPGQIINSTQYALTPLIEAWGGDAVYLGQASDAMEDIKAHVTRGAECDVIVTLGGASVGDYDFVKRAARDLGAEVAFEKVAVRPGKPTWLARMGAQRILGLPGNPASTLVTARLFLRPLIEALGGLGGGAEPKMAVLDDDIPANGLREHYIRAQISERDGTRFVVPDDNQDSSRMIPFLGDSALIRRAVNAPALAKGKRVEVVTLL